MRNKDFHHNKNRSYREMSIGEVSFDSYIELIKYQDNKNQDLEATKELAFRMKKFSQPIGYHVDTSYAIKYLEAFKQYSPSLELETINELQDEIYMIAERLEKTQTNSPPENKRLRKFCKDISDDFRAEEYEQSKPHFFAA